MCGSFAVKPLWRELRPELQLSLAAACRYMKTGFTKYVNLARVNQSMKELALTDKSVTEIALAMGFTSAGYYIQTFRRLKNMTPRQFRKAFSRSTPA